MTLNITLATPSHIYQSADFRLTDGNTGQIVTNTSTKIVNLQYKDFSGFLTYTGVGRFHGKDTSEWLLEWLAEKGDCDLVQVISLIEDKTSAWLDEIATRSGNRHLHSFTLAVFTRRGPSVTVISNFEFCSGQRLSSPADKLFSSSLRIGSMPKTIITGTQQVIPRQQRRLLERLARDHPGASERIRQTLMDVNEAAATLASRGSATRRGPISPECTVLSVASDGSGFQEMTPGVHIEPRFVIRGMPLPDLAQVARDLGVVDPMLVGASFARTPLQNRASQPMRPCRPQVYPGDDREYSIIEISIMNSDSARALQINEKGLILGVASDRSNQAVYDYWYGAEGESAIISGAQNMGAELSCGLSNRGVITGSLTDSNVSCRAFLWEGGVIHDLGCHGGRDSGARCINDNGLVGGWVCIDSDDRGQLNYRPCFWSSARALNVIQGFPGTWGQVVDLNEAGQLLIWCHQDASVAAVIAAEDGTLTPVGRSLTWGMVPICIGDSGETLGFYNDGQHRAVAVIAPGNAPWKELGTPPGWVPAAMNSEGWVAGFISREGFERTWIRSPNNKITILPGYDFHHCRPYAINLKREVVGVARADHGEHALHWSPARG